MADEQTVSAELSFEGDGSPDGIWLEIEGWPKNLHPRPPGEVWGADHINMTVEQAVLLAEEIDAAIDMWSHTTAARKKAKAARIEALSALLADLQADG